MQVSVEDMLKKDAQTSSTNQKVNYFSLKNDGDYAIVRFLHKDIRDLDVLDVHTVPMGNYNRSVNCLRTSNGSKEECVFCKANVKDETTKKYTFPISRKIYIHMIQYSNPQTYTEVVWERGDEFRKKLNQYEQDYGTLCDTIYKIVRHGEAGLKGTTYDILPMPKDRFNPAEYAFDPNLLNYKKALGTVVYDVNNDKMENYLKTGRFVNKDSNVVPRPTEEPPTNFRSEFVMTTPVTQVQNVQPQPVVRENVQPEGYYESNVPTQVRTYQEQPMRPTAYNSMDTNNYSQSNNLDFDFSTTRRKF